MAILGDHRDHRDECEVLVAVVDDELVAMMPVEVPEGLDHRESTHHEHYLPHLRRNDSDLAAYGVQQNGEVLVDRLRRQHSLVG